MCIENTTFCLYNDTKHYTMIHFLNELQCILFDFSHTTGIISYVYFQCFIQVNYFICEFSMFHSSHVLKISEISLVLCTSEFTDIFITFDEIYLVFTSKK